MIRSLRDEEQQVPCYVLDTSTKQNEKHVDMDKDTTKTSEVSGLVDVPNRRTENVKMTEIKSQTNVHDPGHSTQMEIVDCKRTKDDVLYKVTIPMVDTQSDVLDDKPWTGWVPSTNVPKDLIRVFQTNTRKERTSLRPFRKLKPIPKLVSSDAETPDHAMPSVSTTEVHQV